MKPMIIGFAGNAGAGKDTAYRKLSGYSVLNKDCTAVFHQCAFADPLKQAAANAFGIPVNFFYGDFAMKSQIHEPWNVSARQIAQFMGTEMFRETISKLCPHVGDRFWIMRLAKDLDTYMEDTIHCITDVRFQNEADWILSDEVNGVLIKLKRIGATGNIGIQDHASEAGFDVSYHRSRYYEVENNGTEQDLLNTILKPIETHFDLYRK